MPKSQRDCRFYTTLPLSHQSSGLTGTLRGSDFQAHTEVLLCLIDLFAVKLLRCDFHSLPCCVLQCVFTNAQVYTGMCKNKSLLICLLHLTGFFFFFFLRSSQKHGRICCRLTRISMSPSVLPASLSVSPLAVHL